MDKKSEKKKEIEPAPFPQRPKAPPAVRIGAAIALLLLLAAMYLYASRLTAAAETSSPSVAEQRFSVHPLPLSCALPLFSPSLLHPPGRPHI